MQNSGTLIKFDHIIKNCELNEKFKAINMCFNLVCTVKLVICYSSCVRKKVFKTFYDLLMEFRSAFFLWIVCCAIGNPVRGQTVFSGAYSGRDCKLPCENYDGQFVCELRIALILPEDPKYHVSLSKVLPVLG